MITTDIRMFIIDALSESSNSKQNYLNKFGFRQHDMVFNFFYIPFKKLSSLLHRSEQISTKDILNKYLPASKVNVINEFTKKLTSSSNFHH